MKSFEVADDILNVAKQNGICQTWLEKWNLPIIELKTLWEKGENAGHQHVGKNKLFNTCIFSFSDDVFKEFVFKVIKTMDCVTKD